MADLSRRMFLKRSGGSAAALGAFAALPAIPALRRRGPVLPRRPAAVHDAGIAAPAGRAATGPIVVHIPDPLSGQVHLMVGTREVVHTDRALVAHLVRAAG